MDEATLPPIYARWMRELLGGSIPAETQASCGDCVMLPPPDAPAGGTWFRPDTRC